MKKLKNLLSITSFLTVAASLSFLGAVKASDSEDEDLSFESYERSISINNWYMSQESMGWKIAKALEKNKTIDATEENREKVIKYFNETEGDCVAYSTLWLYGRKISDECPASTQPRDDVDFFKSTIDMLKEWNFNGGPLSEEKQNSVENLANHLLNFQEVNQEVYEKKITTDESKKFKRQIDLALTLEDTKRGAPVEVGLVFELKLTEKMLQNRIESFVKPGVMTFLSSRLLTSQGREGHMMAAYQNKSDGRIFFFNPNVGEMEFENFKGVSENYWKGLVPNWCENTDTFRKVSVIAYNFEKDGITTFPSFDESRATNDEILEMFKDNPKLSTAEGAKKSGLEDFLHKENVPEDQLVELLKDTRISKNAKKRILRNVPERIKHML